MVLPVEAIEASVDAPGILEIKPGQKTVRLTYRATLRNTGDETRVLHAPSLDHTHFWHLFDENLTEIGRERRGGRGGEKESPNPRRFRGLTVGPGQEVHATRTIRIDRGMLAAGSGRYLLRVDLWGQSAETEFHAVVRPATPTPARKRPAKKKTVAKRKAATTRKVAPKKKAAAKKKITRKASAKRKAVAKKTTAKEPAARKKASRGRARKRTAKRK